MACEECERLKKQLEIAREVLLAYSLSGHLVDDDMVLEATDALMAMDDLEESFLPR